MKTIHQEIMGLDTAMELPVYIKLGTEITKDEKRKAIYNVERKKVSSIVNKNYHLVQHKDVVGATVEALENLNIKMKHRIRNAGDKVLVDIEFPEVKVNLQKGEEFIGGIRIINSYDKSTGIMVLPRMMRLVCDNGMVVDRIIKSSIKLRHTGKLAADLAPIIEKEIKVMVNSCEKLKTVVSNCMKDSVEWEIAETVLEGMFKRKKHVEAIKERLKGIDKPTRWDIYNAVTNYCTHGEQLRPVMEHKFQGKAQQILQKPLAVLAERYEK